LAQPELRQELGIKDTTGADAEFKYDLAFQETFIKDDVTTGMFELSELVGQSSTVVIPVCKGRTCILATYDEDEETGALGLVGYGSSVRSSRIAESYARLAKIRPGYKGEAQIVDYPAGMVSFLMIDSQGPNGEITKEFIHATDDQAKRFEQGEAQIVALEDMAEFIVKVDNEARRNAVQFGPIEETRDEGETTHGSLESNKTKKEVAVKTEEEIKNKILTVEQKLKIEDMSDPTGLSETIVDAEINKTLQTNTYIYIAGIIITLGTALVISRRRLVD
jgi:hypothetical protein